MTSLLLTGEAAPGGPPPAVCSPTEDTDLLEQVCERPRAGTAWRREGSRANLLMCVQEAPEQRNWRRGS